MRAIRGNILDTETNNEENRPTKELCVRKRKQQKQTNEKKVELRKTNEKIQET
jgi:hypothetical protein